MLVVILLYDQLLFRPLLGMVAQIPRRCPADEDYVRPWFLIVLQRARLFDLVQRRRAARPTAPIDGALARGCRAGVPASARRRPRRRRAFERLFDLALLALAGRRRGSGSCCSSRASVPAAEIGWVFVLGLITAFRVLVLIALASLIWVPIGVWIGLRPRLADAGAAGRAIPRGVSGQSVLSGGGRADPAASGSTPRSGSAR